MFALTITQSRVSAMYKHCIRFSHVSSYLCNVVWITLAITCLENHASPGYWGGILWVSGKSLYPGTLLHCRGMRHACQIRCTIWCHHRRAILKCASGLHIVHVWQVLVLCMIWPRVTGSPEKAIYFLPCHLCRNCCLQLCFIVHGTQIGQFVMCPVVNHPCRTGGYIMCYVNIMQLCKSSAWDTCLFSVLNVSHKAYWQAGLRWGNLSLHIFLPLFLTS